MRDMFEETMALVNCTRSKDYKTHVGKGFCYLCAGDSKGHYLYRKGLKGWLCAFAYKWGQPQTIQTSKERFSNMDC